MTEDEKHAHPWRLHLHFHRKSSTAQPPTPAKRLDFTKDIPVDIPYPPFVNVEGVPNFRDVGGYACPPPATADPSRKYSIRPGYVFRCSELSQITPHGDEMLTGRGGFNIRTLYDLRSEREAANPRGQPKGVKCISVPVFAAQDVTKTMQVQQLRWGTAPDEAGVGFSQGYVDWYRQIAVYGAKNAYRVVFEHIRDRPEEPFVFHCTAGKDRTGVLSALVLKLCGVEDDVVGWEYSLTVPGMGVWEEMVEMEMVGDSMMPVRSHGGMTREEARRICGSRKANMDRWLDIVLKGEFGGAEGYLKNHCGFSNEDVAKMKRNLIVEGEATVEPVEVPGSEEHSQT